MPQWKHFHVLQKCICIKVAVQIGSWLLKWVSQQSPVSFICFTEQPRRAKQLHYSVIRLDWEMCCCSTVLRVPCAQDQRRDSPSCLPPHPRMQTAGCCPSKPAVYFSNPLCCAALLVTLDYVCIRQDSVTLVWFGGIHCRKNYSCKWFFGLVFFPPENADFIPYYLSDMVLFSDKLPLLVLYCVTGSSLSHLTQSAAHNLAEVY